MRASWSMRSDASYSRPSAPRDLASASSRPGSPSAPLGPVVVPASMKKNTAPRRGLEAGASWPGARGWREERQQTSEVVQVHIRVSTLLPRLRVVETSLPSGSSAPPPSPATTESTSAGAAPTLKYHKLSAAGRDARVLGRPSTMTD